MSSRALAPSVRKKCGQLAKLVVQMLCSTAPLPGPQPSEVSTEVGGIAAWFEADAVQASAWRQFCSPLWYPSSLFTTDSSTSSVHHGQHSTRLAQVMHDCQLQLLCSSQVVNAHMLHEVAGTQQWAARCGATHPVHAIRRGLPTAGWGGGQAGHVQHS